MSDTLSAGIKMIVFSVVTLLATGILAATIGNYTFKDTNGYKAVFTDAVNLVHGDEVRLAGVRVGSIGSVELVNGRQALVSFSVEKNIPLTTTTRAVIRYRNLIGQRYLAIVDGPSDGRPLAAGSTIPLARTRPALDLNALFDGFRPLLTALSPADVNQLSFELIRVLQGEGSTVNTLFDQVGSLTSTLADHDRLIGALIGDLNGMLGPLDRRDQQVGTLVNNMQRLVSGLSADRNAIGDSLVGIDSLTGETAGLLDRARPALKTDVAALGELARKLDLPKSRRGIKHFLDYEPFKLRVASAITGYGAFQNFYLCSANFILPDGTVTDPYFNAAKRCTNP
jgi:phospholipid/cholesterol/gamma-HCH transport system substrate-binding protein